MADSYVEVLLQGHVQRAIAEYPLDTAGDETLLDGTGPQYFALVRAGTSSAPTFSLRFYTDKPANDKNVRCATVADVLAATPRKAAASLTASVQLTSAVRIQEVKSALWLLTPERSIALRDQSKRPPAISGLHEYLRQIQVELADQPAPASASAPPSGARASGGGLRAMLGRVSQRLSGPRGGGGSSSGGVVAGAGGQYPALGGRGKRATLRRNSVQRVSSAMGTLEDILDSKALRKEFRAYLKFAFAEENLAFIEAVEAFEAMPPNPPRARVAAFADIVRQFVVQHAPEQVNLPSYQSRLLEDTLRDLEEEAGAASIDGGAFLASKREILDLVYRNFFTPFVSQVQQRAMREQRAKEMTGSLAQLWTHAGLEGYNMVVETFQPNLDALQQMREFFLDLQAHVDQQLATLRRMAGKYPALANSDGRVPREKTLGRIVFQLFSGLNLKIGVLEEFSRDIFQVGVQRMRELESTVASSVQTIYQGNLGPVQEMLDARKALQGAIVHETEVYRAHRAAKEQPAPGAKSGKKLAASLDKLAAQLAEAVAAREACELTVSGKESAHADAMLNAFDMLESLELHRLDTERAVLTQVALAERSAHAKAGLAIQSVLFDCVEMDPVAEIMSLAADMKEQARVKRPTFIAQAVAVPPR